MSDFALRRFRDNYYSLADKMVDMPPTQKELAKLAGVSSGTVSNVINGVAEVSERSRRKVLNAIKELNYQPNLIARSLRTNRTHTLGIIIPDITIPFFARVIRGGRIGSPGGRLLP